MLEKYADRIETVSGDYKIAEGVYLIPHKTANLEKIGKREMTYRKTPQGYKPDNFSHEQSLVLDTDKGLERRLSPVDEQQQEQRDIQRSNVLQIRLDDSDALFCDDQPVTLGQLQQQVESFLASRMSKQYVIAVETSRKTSYNAYFEMQNAIVAAHKKLNCFPMKISEGVR